MKAFSKIMGSKISHNSFKLCHKTNSEYLEISLIEIHKLVFF